MRAPRDCTCIFRCSRPGRGGILHTFLSLVWPLTSCCLVQMDGIDTVMSDELISNAAASVAPPSTAFESQEGEQTSRAISVIMHRDRDHYIVNLHSLHNAHLLLRIFPQDSLQAPPFVSDRRAHHYAIATTLRSITEDKREISQAKRAVVQGLKRAALTTDGNAGAGPSKKTKCRYNGHGASPSCIDQYAHTHCNSS